MSGGLQSEERRRRRRGIQGGRVDERGMPFHLELSLPHSHFSAHDGGKGESESHLYLYA